MIGSAGLFLLPDIDQFEGTGVASVLKKKEILNCDALIRSNRVNGVLDVCGK